MGGPGRGQYQGQEKPLKNPKSPGTPKVPEFLSTHPSHERRIKDLEEYLPVAMTYYNPQN